MSQDSIESAWRGSCTCLLAARCSRRRRTPPWCSRQRPRRSRTPSPTSNWCVRRALMRRQAPVPNACHTRACPLAVGYEPAVCAACPCLSPCHVIRRSLGQPRARALRPPTGAPHTSAGDPLAVHTRHCACATHTVPPGQHTPTPHHRQPCADYEPVPSAPNGRPASTPGRAARLGRGSPTRRSRRPCWRTRRMRTSC